jgi:hypothetical protein
MSFQVREQVTVLPAVAGSQNGKGKVHTVRRVYGVRGQLIWAKSPRGYQTSFQYEDASGAMVRPLEDAIIKIPYTHTVPPQ